MLKKKYIKKINRLIKYKLLYVYYYQMIILKWPLLNYNLLTNSSFSMGLFLNIIII